MSNDVAVPDTSQEPTFGPVAQHLIQEHKALSGLFEELRSRALTPLTVALAVEYDTRAKAFEAAGTKACELPITHYHREHKKWTTFRAKLLLPVAPLRDLCSQIVSDYKLAQVKKERETAAPAQRAEIAQQSQTVLAGVATTQVWEGELEDFAKFVDYVAAHHELLFLLIHVQGDLNRYVTRMKGKVEIPGVKVIERMVTRNRNSDAG